LVATLGEISLADIQRLIEAELAQLPDGARQQAKQILGDYLAYKAALTEIAEAPVGQSLDPMQMRNHLERLRALRRDTLGQPVSEAFFAT
jgi:lipase chaperone LimK